MRVQTLVVTTDQADRSLPGRMNLQTDAVIGNQCGRDAVETVEADGRRMLWLSSAQRGVGFNRNAVLLRADGDFLVLADDDMTFLDGYAATVTEWFARLPDADVLIFNLQGGKPRYVNRRVVRIHRFNYGKYGAARLVLRADAVRFSGVTFNTLFGGGARYSCGEDSIFLHDCLGKGLRIYAVPAVLAEIRDDESTWFSGYTDRYFFDRGVLFFALCRRGAGLYALCHCLRNRKRYADYGLRRALAQMRKGIRSAVKR